MSVQPADLARRDVRPSWRRTRGPALPILLGLLCFFNTLPNAWVYDDLPLVAGNARVRDASRLAEIWWSDWAAPAPEGPVSFRGRAAAYRPLALTTLAVQHAAFGPHPITYHLINTLLHTAICGLVWVFVQRLTGSAVTALIAGLLFAVHPVHVEAVAAVMGRGELLAAGFIVGGLLLLQPRRESPGLVRVILAAFAMLAAVLSHEMAVCYPVVALLVLLWQRRPAKNAVRTGMLQGVILLLPLVVYAVLRFVALGGHLIAPAWPDVAANPLIDAAGWSRVAGLVTVLGHTTRLLVLPANLSCDYGLAVITPDGGVTPFTMLGVAALLAAVVGLGGAFSRRRERRLIAAVMAMAVVSYAVISNVFALQSVGMAERQLYWPSVPLLIVIAIVVRRFWLTQCQGQGRLASSANLLKALGVVFIVTLGIRAVVRNLDWRDDLRLMGRDVATRPASVRLHTAYGAHVLAIARTFGSDGAHGGLYEEANAHARRALELYPAHLPALTLAGNLLSDAGDVDGALLHAEAALMLDPFDGGAQLLERAVFGETEDDDRWRATLEADVRADPDDGAARLSLADKLIALGRPAEAALHLDHVLRNDPRELAALRMFGEVQVMLGQRGTAITTWEEVLARAPDDTAGHAALAYLLRRRDPHAALAHAERVVAARPDEPGALLRLAELRARIGQRDDAVALLKRVGKLVEPESPIRDVLRERLGKLGDGGRT
jgi:tetratricopeptide (TPR) repeat protein